jgi:hypothetical protein
MTDNEFARLLRDAVPEPPSLLSPDAVLRGAKRRGLLRLTAVGGTTAAAVVAGVIVMWPFGSDTATLIGSTPPGSAAPALPPCPSTSLRAIATGGGVISNGFTGATVTLTNTGKTPCHLAGRITSLIAAKAQTELPIVFTAGDHGGPQDLDPGASAAFNIASIRVSGGSGDCIHPAPANDAAPPVLQFHLQGTGDPVVSLESGVFTLGCWPVVVTNMYAATPTSTTSPAPIASGPFRSTDVTFVSATHGWAIAPGRLVQTVDGGDTWTRVTAPPGYADHVRFASDRIGYAWALQKGLSITRDGGVSWQPAKLTRVLQLEAAAGYVWAIAGDEPYPGVWRGTVGGPSFTKVGQTPDRSGTLDVHGANAYVVGIQGAGPIGGSLDVWTGLRRTNDALPCKGNSLYIPDSPLGVSTDGSVFLVCDVEHLVQDQTPAPEQWAYVSGDQGRSWTRRPAPPETPTDVTATRNGLFAWGKSVERYDGTRWVVAIRGAGFVTVGFQDDAHGIALGRDGRLYLTRDGGSSWTTARF